MATTFLIARHGEADYEHPGVLHDEGGWLTPLGRHQVTALAGRVRERGVTAVWTSTLSRAVESGSIAARELGVPASSVDGLHEFPAGELTGRSEYDPALGEEFAGWLAAGPDAPLPGGAETGRQAIDRFRTALESIGQRHAGETVLVVSHGGVMGYVVPRLAVNVADDLAGGGYLPNCAVMELRHDGEYEIVAWPEYRPWPRPATEPPPG